MALRFNTLISSDAAEVWGYLNVEHFLGEGVTADSSLQKEATDIFGRIRIG